MNTGRLTACVDATIVLKWVLPEEMNYTAARMYQAAQHGFLRVVAPRCEEELNKS